MPYTVDYYTKEVNPGLVKLSLNWISKLWIDVVSETAIAAGTVLTEKLDIDGLVQDCSNSIAKAMVSRFSFALSHRYILSQNSMIIVWS